MMNTHPYNKRFNSLLLLLKEYREEEEDTAEQDALIRRMGAILDYMERQGYVLANTFYPYYFVPVERPSWQRSQELRYRSLLAREKGNTP